MERKEKQLSVWKQKEKLKEGKKTRILTRKGKDAGEKRRKERNFFHTKERKER